MRQIASASLVAVSMLLFAACGQPKAGESCDESGFLCESGTAALQCKLGTWVSLPCRGTSGCTVDGDVVKCDMTGNVEGDECASSAAGRGLCTVDGLGALECRSNDAGRLVLTKTMTCRSCIVQGGVVQCQP